MAASGAPTGEEIKAAIDPYAHKLGMVAFSWNRLIETLGLFFVYLTETSNPHIAQVIWYSFDSDRMQIKLLRTILAAIPFNHWDDRLSKAPNDLDWLFLTSEKLIDSRNDAVHGPAMMLSDGEKLQMVCDISSFHRKAVSLRDKDLLA